MQLILNHYFQVIWGHISQGGSISLGWKTVSVRPGRSYSVQSKVTNQPIRAQLSIIWPITAQYSHNWPIRGQYSNVWPMAGWEQRTARVGDSLERSGTLLPMEQFLVQWPEQGSVSTPVSPLSSSSSQSVSSEWGYNKPGEITAKRRKKLNLSKAQYICGNFLCNSKLVSTV